MSYSILIVDDSAITRAVLKKTFTMLDYPIDQIYEARDGNEALDILHEHCIDLITTDLNMPVMNGMQMNEAVLSDPETCEIPILVITAEACPVRIKQLEDQGIKGYIHKPFTPESVRDELAKIIDPSLTN